MSRGRFLFVAWIGLLLIGCGGDEATKPSGRTDFAGEWSNVDPDTPSITRIGIVEIDSALRIHMWGRCHPEDCDWGESDVPGSDAEDGQLSVAWDMGFCEISQILELENDGRLRVDSHTDHVDPGRPDQDATDWFSRSVDSQAPQAVSDLRVTAADAHSVTLSWTAPHDNGPLGRAASYDLRYGTDANLAWSSLTEASGEPGPAAAGTAETFTVTGLTADQTYVFGIKSVDAAGNGPGPTGAESVRTGEPASRRACAGGANARPGGRSAVGILQERPDRLRNGSFR